MLQVCAVDFTAYHFLAPLMRGSRDAGWEVEFACADGAWAASLRAEGFRHRVLPVSRSIALHRNLLAIIVLAASLRRRPVDLIHTHTPIGGIVGRAAALLTTIPVVHTFHGLPFAGAATSARERAFVLVERLLARRTSFFLSQAEGDVERAVALGIADGQRMEVIGNGVDLDRFRPDPTDREQVRRELGVLPSDTVVVTVSRIVREKGVLVLADAALVADRPGMHILVVGAALPSDRTNVEAELAAHPASRSLGSRWHRLGERRDVERVLRSADIFVLPSFREGLPRTVIEAMATGLPVVASDIPACRELLDATTGRLVPPGDAGRLAGAIAELVDDPVGRAAMGASARRRAVERHDERAVIRSQLAILSRISQ